MIGIVNLVKASILAAVLILAMACALPTKAEGVREIFGEFDEYEQARLATVSQVGFLITTDIPDDCFSSLVTTEVAAKDILKPLWRPEMETGNDDTSIMYVSVGVRGFLISNVCLASLEMEVRSGQNVLTLPPHDLNGQSWKVWATFDIHIDHVDVIELPADFERQAKAKILEFTSFARLLVEEARSRSELSQ